MTDRLQEIRDRVRTAHPDDGVYHFPVFDLNYLLREIDRLQADNDRLSLAYHELIVRNAIKDTPAD